MKLVQLIDYLKKHLKAVIRLCLALLLLLVVIDAFPFLVDKEHAHTGWERLPGFWAIFGLVGCIVLIILSKWFGHLGIMTREDYYDE